MAGRFANVKPDVRRRMKRVRQRDTDVEMILRRELWGRGIRYRLHGRNLPGRPDIYNGRLRVAVFVDGCFWHGCPTCKKIPQTRRAFWKAKIAYNRSRRRTVQRDLETRGWTIVQVWEHAIRLQPEAAAGRVARVWQRQTDLAASRA